LACQQEEKAWFERALSALEEAGPIGRASATYVRQRDTALGFSRQRDTALGFSRQRDTGASWFDWRRLRFGVFLNADYADGLPDDARLCSLLAHEIEHLEQGMLEALSVRGELVAWQLQYDVLKEFSAEPADRAWRELRQLAPVSRIDLRRGQRLMKMIGGPSYRIDWLPLTPLPAEIAHHLKQAARRLTRFLRS